MPQFLLMRAHGKNPAALKSSSWCDSNRHLIIPAACLKSWLMTSVDLSPPLVFGKLHCILMLCFFTKVFWYTNFLFAWSFCSLSAFNFTFQSVVRSRQTVIIGMTAVPFFNALLKEYLTLMHMHCPQANTSIAVKQSPIFDKNVSLLIFLRQNGACIVSWGLIFS